MATISDRVSNVALELGNRSDLSAGVPSRIVNWLLQSYTDLAYDYPFEDLQDFADLTTTSNQWFMDFDPTWRAINGITAYRLDGTPIPLDYKDIRYLRRYSETKTSIPSVWADYKNQIQFRPVSNGTYKFTIDVWLKPFIETVIADTTLHVPDDWLEIIDMGAILRGHRSLLERDKAREMQELLFGFNDPRTGRITPGLIHAKWTRRQAQAPMQDYGMRPKVRSYTNSV